MGRKILANPATLFALFLLLTSAAALVALSPFVTAQAPTMKTYAVIDAVPNPVGVGQEVLIRFGVLEQTADRTVGWNLTLDITGPDNVKRTLGPFLSDSTGGTFYVTSFDKPGVYKLQAHFPQQVNPKTWFDMEGNRLIFEGTIMLASDSDVLELVVQQEPLPTYPPHSLPTEYWTRPIDQQLREWASVAGNWLARPDNSFALYNDYAPETAHVLWAKPLTSGGLVGGYLGPGQIPAGTETGDAYAGKFIDSVIIRGILYYNRDDGKVGSNGICAVDLHTGEELWFRNNTVLSFGQTLYYDGFNMDGVFCYLWDASAGTTWHAYNPSTGEWLYTIKNMPSGTRVYGPSGEILIYVVDYANGWMALWNSTACGHTAPLFAAEPAAIGSWHAYYMGRLVHGQVLDASDPRCYSWNVTIPKGLSAGLSFFTPILKVYPDRVVSVDFNQTRVRVWALNTKGLTKTSTSTYLLFDKEWKAPAEWLAGSNVLHYVGATNEVENGVIAVWSKELRKHYAFSVEDGRFLWETPSEPWLDAYGWGNVEHTWYFAYGKLYSVGVAGILYAYDLATGKIAWTYNMTDPYGEPVTGNNWWGWIALIADGKIYLGTLEHSAEQPLPRGGPFICLNAEDGSEIWRVNGMFRQTRWGGNAVIGDSIIATMDTYDQRIYAIGRGPSATTVEAPLVGVPLGSSVVIRGTVTDVSPGTKDSQIALRFPNGVPAVADECMSDWMLYVYKQFERPSNVKGVWVKLDAINVYTGEYIDIGGTHTDSAGFFTVSWKPPKEGLYTILATFPGSKAYYPSFAETSITVTAAPTEIVMPEIPAYPEYRAMDLAIIVAVAIAILIGIANLFALRKRR